MSIDFTELNQKLQYEEKELWERLQTVTQLRTSLKTVFGDSLPAAPFSATSLPVQPPATGQPPTANLANLASQEAQFNSAQFKPNEVTIAFNPPLTHSMRRSPVSDSKMPTSELVVYVLKRVGHGMPSAAIASEIWEDSRVPNKPDSQSKVKVCVQSAVYTLRKAGIVRKCTFGWELVPGKG
jgi:hypothetical protein